MFNSLNTQGGPLLFGMSDCKVRFSWQISHDYSGSTYSRQWAVSIQLLPSGSPNRLPDLYFDYSIVVKSPDENRADVKHYNSGNPHAYKLSRLKYFPN